MVSFAWAGFGAAFGPLILLGLFWRRTTLAGAIAGMVAGASTCFVWKFLLASNAALVQKYPIFELYELAPGFAVALFATVLFSLLSKKPDAAILEEFDRVSRLGRAAE
jgi:sodium/proline symporter